MNGRSSCQRPRLDAGRGAGERPGLHSALAALDRYGDGRPIDAVTALLDEGLNRATSGIAESSATPHATEPPRSSGGFSPIPRRIGRSPTDRQDPIPRNVLIIEDQRDIANLIKLHLHEIGCRVAIVTDGAAGLAEACRNKYDLIVLDLILPKEDGLEVCRKLRALGRYVPIMMVTARVAEAERVLGLETGADDYITKPFSIVELVARVRALFRRAKIFAAPPPPPKIISIGEMIVDTGKRLVLLRQKAVDLTVKEYDLLLHLARNPGQVFTRLELLTAVWGYHHSGYEHTVNSHINRLRAKIEDDSGHPAYVQTVWGVGYKFVARP